MLSRRTCWIMLFVVLSFPFMAVQAQDTAADLAGIQTYLIEQATALHEAADRQAESAAAYYALAEAAEFDYETLWASEEAAVREALLATRAAWIEASPLYEQIEGVVAGVPSLSEYDVNLDAGVSGAEDPEGGVTFDLTLPDGTVMERPGNLFGILESALWGTIPEYTSGVTGDLDENGTVDFGEVLPDANLVRGAAAMMSSMTEALLADAEAWEPTTSDAFTALVVMVPTMSEYFGSWKESRFVAGDESTATNFVVISRLADIQDILSGLEVIYAGVGPLVEAADPAQDTQIETGLADLRAYVADLYTQELDGRQFTAEEADFFGSEAQDRAMQIAGQITQVAALLDIELAE
jgi:Imelysin